MAPISTPDDTHARPTSTRSSFRSAMRGMDQASIMSVELLAGILTWAAIGWLVDSWLGIGPWGLVVGSLVGYAAGLYLVILRSRHMEGYEEPARAAGGASDGG